jgi:hypothetical protein
MKKIFAISILVLAATAVFALASISGTWNAKVDLGGQGGSPTFILKQDGEKLTGTYSGALGDAPLTGTVKGDKVTFDFNIQDNKIHYEGTVNAEGNHMEGTCDYAGQASGTFTATLSKPKSEK